MINSTATCGQSFTFLPKNDKIRLNFPKRNIMPKAQRVSENGFCHAKQKVDNSKKSKLKPLSKCFKKNSQKEIYEAICDGHSATSIAKYLSVSNSYITIKMKNYKQKITLFEKLKQKGIFWSYDKNITYDKFNDDLFIEYTLKYADFDDIKKLLCVFGKNKQKGFGIKG